MQGAKTASFCDMYHFQTRAKPEVLYMETAVFYTTDGDSIARVWRDIFFYILRSDHVVVLLTRKAGYLSFRVLLRNFVQRNSLHVSEKISILYVVDGNNVCECSLRVSIILARYNISIFNESRYGFVVDAVVVSQILAGQLSFSLSRWAGDYIGARAECFH